MIDSRKIFLLSDEVRAVMVTYEDREDAARTMYKTLNQKIKVDDYVVIPTDSRHNMTVCKVVEVDVDPDLESSVDIKWIIDVVDMRAFNKVRGQESDAIGKIRSAEKRRKRQELADALLADAADDVKALPIYTAAKIGAK